MAQGIFLDEFLGICLLVAFPSSVSVIQGVSRGVVSEFQRLESPLPKGILLRKPQRFRFVGTADQNLLWFSLGNGFL